MEQSFGSFLAEKRKEKNLTQKELANKLFVTESAVSKWERDIAKPDISMVAEISKLLQVSEHELITASVDNERIKEKSQARKWKNLVTTYDMIFYIGYGLALFTCFIVNVATSGTLSWFFIVLGSILLAFSLTSLARFIKKFKLLILSCVPLVLLFLLLLICSIYVGGNWLIIAFAPVLFGFICVFLPLYVNAYFPTIIKRHSALFNLFVDALSLVILLCIIERFTNGSWFIPVALPLVGISIILTVGLIIIIRYLKLNKLLKTAFCLLWSAVFSAVVCPMVLKIVTNNFNVVINNYTSVNLANWGEAYINGNVEFLIVITLAIMSIIFFTFGIIKRFKKHI